MLWLSRSCSSSAVIGNPEQGWPRPGRGAHPSPPLVRSARAELALRARLTGQSFQVEREVCAAPGGAESYDPGAPARARTPLRVRRAWTAWAVPNPTTQPAPAATHGPAKYAPTPAAAPTPRAVSSWARNG